MWLAGECYRGHEAWEGRPGKKVHFSRAPSKDPLSIRKPLIFLISLSPPNIAVIVYRHERIEPLNEIQVLMI